MTVRLLQGIDLRKSYLLIAEMASTSVSPCLRMLHEAGVCTGKHKDSRASRFYFHINHHVLSTSSCSHIATVTYLVIVVYSIRRRKLGISTTANNATSSSFLDGEPHLRLQCLLVNSVTQHNL